MSLDSTCDNEYYYITRKQVTSGKVPGKKIALGTKQAGFAHASTIVLVGYGQQIAARVWRPGIDEQKASCTLYDN